MHVNLMHFKLAIRYTLILCSTPKIKYVGSHKRNNISFALMSETYTVGSVDGQTKLVVLPLILKRCCFVGILHMTLQNSCSLKGHNNLTN